MWYETERNTEALLKAIATPGRIEGLSGEQAWRLLQLTWITSHNGRTTEDHWKRLKVPALAALFDKPAAIQKDLKLTIDTMRLPGPVAQAAGRETGFVNIRAPYRNSVKTWCATNIRELRAIMKAARRLGTNDQSRFDLASRIERLPRVPTPTGRHKMTAANVITPLIACLDPRRRFPIINGEKGVVNRLTKLDLVDRGLADQARGFIGLIGQIGLADAFAVDTMTEDQIEKIRKRSEKRYPADGERGKDTTPHYFDEAEWESVQQSRTVIYRQRHNKITNRLQELLGLNLPPGNSANCRYDLLVANYDRTGRDLLIEAKPDPDMSSLRIAIGQLLDYRRFLPRQAVTDLAILTISRPSQDYVELLQDLQITPLWFPDERCQTLAGDGKAWESLKSIL